MNVSGVVIGNGNFVIIGGPCAVESKEQILASAKAVKKSGAKMLRGGAYKPRSSPHSFQGLGEKALSYLLMAKKETGLPIVTEVIDEESLQLSKDYADVLQIGARNMHNYSLLRLAGKSGKPIILKRGLCATIDEWLLASEYILNEGNEKVILCERGIRTFETATRNTLDLSAVVVLKSRTDLPVIVDPSHATGNSRYVSQLAKAALAVGADGVMVEMHTEPENALSDKEQALTEKQFDEMCKELKRISSVFGVTV